MLSLIYDCSRTASSATHIITSTGLSGSKSQKFLQAGTKKSNLHVVKPEWLHDSIDAGRRLNEFTYRVVVSETQKELEWKG